MKLTSCCFNLVFRKKDSRKLNKFSFFLNSRAICRVFFENENYLKKNNSTYISFLRSPIYDYYETAVISSYLEKENFPVRFLFFLTPKLYIQSRLQFCSFLASNNFFFYQKNAVTKIRTDYRSYFSPAYYEFFDQS